MLEYLVVFAIVLGVNLLPAFGPPTWSILVLFRFRSDLNPVALVLVGALAAATGRYALGHLSRLFRDKLSEKRRKSLDAMHDRLMKHKKAGLLSLFLFALSPLPSAQLFEAAGLTKMRMLPITVAFFIGRIVSYSIYVAGASALKQTSMGEIIKKSFTSPLGIGLQILFLALVVLLARVDWAKHVGEGPAKPREAANAHQ